MHWIKYIDIAKGADAVPFPVSTEDILGWSLTFRCLGTFSNYLTHIRGASCALGHEPPPVGHPAIKRAMGAIAKRMLFSPRSASAAVLARCLLNILVRPKHAIQRTMLKNMIERDGNVLHGALWLLSYTWLLRLPSEVGRTGALACALSFVVVAGAAHVHMCWRAP